MIKFSPDVEDEIYHMGSFSDGEGFKRFAVHTTGWNSFYANRHHVNMFSSNNENIALSFGELIEMAYEL